MASTARSSGLNDRSGAREHTLGSTWQGALAFSNIGLAGKAFSGAQWEKKTQGSLARPFQGTDVVAVGPMLASSRNGQL